jgi:Asp-tRNA(Asn)/Glu-tRNA(Gln) amidotransferase A subunit family amidase
LSVKGYKTTWGAMPYKDQMIDEDATVVKRCKGRSKSVAGGGLEV